MKAVLVREGGVLSYEDVPDPVAGPGEVIVELRAAAVNRRDLLVRNSTGARVRVRPAADPRLRRSGRAAGHRRGGRHLPRARLGSARGRRGAGLADSRRPRRRHLRRARQAAGGERLPEAGALLVGGGGCISARGADRIPRALRGRPADRRRECADPRGRKRRVDDRGAACCAGRLPGRRHLVVAGEDRPGEGARRRGRGALHGGGLGGGGGAGRRRARLGRLDLAGVAEGAPARAGGWS